MKFKISKYEFVKTLVKDFEINIPEEPVYFFERGVRRSIRIIPVRTTWRVNQGFETEEINHLKITIVNNDSIYDTVIQDFNINLHMIDNLYLSDNKNIKKEIINNILINNWGDKRTKEQFDQDLKTALLNINNY